MRFDQLTIIIVTFKSEEKIYSCLNSIPNQANVIIVENSSNQNFKESIERKYPNVRCLLAGKNLGYATANNIGLEQVNTKFALILNPDTSLKEDTIKNFFVCAEKIPDFWLIGPSNNQSKNISFGENLIQEVNNLKGFGVFFNIEKFKKKFFDENYFLYFEEIDLCANIKKKGGKIYLSKNIIIHHDSASSVNRDNALELEKNRNWHWMWSTFYFYKKHKGFTLAILLIFPKLISSIFKILFYLIAFNKDKRDIYFCRMSGILNSIFGKKSWYRPKLD
tara:strand:- start:530 stop:1363 length:834 start_codon:yes stop_codon:yes gene_type:complete